MVRQYFRKIGCGCLLPYVLLFIFLCIPVTPVLGYKPVRFIVTDLNGKPLEGAIVALETIDTIFILPPTNETGITQSIDPIPQGAYRVTVKWKSQYRDDFSLIFSGNIQIGEPYIFELKTNVFPITIKFVTPKGVPINGASVYINGQAVGYTRSNGTLRIPQITVGSYNIEATWLGVEIGPGLVEIDSEGTQVITAQNVNQLTIVVRGAQGQKLNDATVRINKADSEIMLKLTDKEGKVEVELPSANYSLVVSYGQFVSSSSVFLTKDKIVMIFLDVFIELLGVGMSMAQFLLLIVMIEVIVIMLSICVHKMEVKRRELLKKRAKREERKETKPASIEARKRRIEEIKASFTVRDFFPWILSFTFFLFILSAIFVIVINLIAGFGFTLRETVEKILEVFSLLVTTITSLISVYTMTHRKRTETE